MAKERKKKSGFLGKFVAALIGFVIGILATVGGIAGFGYYVATSMTLKEGINTIGDMTGSKIDYKDFLTESFASNTILEAIGDIQDFAQDASDGSASLGSLETFTPIRDKLEPVIDKAISYGLPMTMDELMAKPFSQLDAYILESIDNMEIGKAAGQYAGEISEMLKLISYGELDHEFIEKDVDYDGEMDVVMLGNNTPTKLSDLMTNDKFTTILSHISLAGFLKSTGNSHNDDELFRAFLYGEENVDYVLVDNGSTESVQMLPRLYTFDSNNNTFLEEESEETYTYMSGVWHNSKLGYTITSYNTDGYAYAVVDSDRVLVELLKEVDTNSYEVYRFPSNQSILHPGVKQLRRGLTMGDLMEEGIDIERILYDIAVADLLDLNGDSDSLMLTIAYGEEGVDYTVDPVTKEITPITPPTKVGDLLDLDTFKDKLYDLYLADILDITPFDDPKPDSMLLLLAYGEEGVHYELIDTNSDGTDDDIQWLNDENGNPYGKRTLRDLITDGENVFDSISVASVLNVTTSSDPLLINLAYGPSSRYQIEGSTFVMNPITYSIVNGIAYDDINIPCDGVDEHGTTSNLGGGIYFIDYTWKADYYISQATDGKYYAYATQADAQTGLAENRLTYKKQMLSSLRGTEATHFLDEIELGAALDVSATEYNDPDKKLMVALAYGYNGIHFDVNGTTVTWNANPVNGLYYRPRTLKDLRDMESIIQTIKIVDFFGEIDEANTLLYALRDETVGTLEDAIQGLTIDDILGKDSGGNSIAESNRFLKSIATTKIGEIATTMTNLKIVDVFADEAYDSTTGNLTGPWIYMLDDPNDIKSADDYTVEDFDEMMDNMSTNIKAASLQELVDNQVLTFNFDLEQTTFMGVSLNTLLKEATGDATRTEQKLGDLSLLDLVQIIVAFEEMPTI
ncbi:MAG: hypothetical protein IJY11_01480 [Clostridia bacterium]|nr:hypothetical protein [Clostridia bacterium]